LNTAAAATITPTNEATTPRMTYGLKLVPGASIMAMPSIEMLTPRTPIATPRSPSAAFPSEPMPVRAKRD
jgi:hypothetical protein